LVSWGRFSWAGRPIPCLYRLETPFFNDRAGVSLTRHLLIVGSGPAAAGAALSAVEHPDVAVTVIDVGGRLERTNQETVDRMAGVDAGDWASEDVATIIRQPVDSDLPGLPEKRAFGSDFPFRDFGQRGPLRSRGINEAIVSGAYGGFSNAWGAQFMPFTDATFADWPVPATEMRDHYAKVLRHIPLAAEEDDLAELFPILGAADHLPELSPRSSAALGRYAAHRTRLHRAGVLMGRARLAFQASRCVRCGLCMTGCPHSLIYSAAQTFTALRDDSRITYRDGLLALRVEDGPDSATVVARDLGSGRLERLSADRVMLACGAIGTARLVLGSLELFDRRVPVRESPQFQLPFLSARPVPDPRGAPDFTLNQFNMVIRHDATERDVSQLHFYTYNPAFEDALPGPLRGDRATPLRKQLLRRICVALGYLPSWAAPEFAMSVRPPTDEGSLPELVLEANDSESPFRNPMMRQVARRVAAAGPLLDLWPVLPALRMSAGGKSYHWGAIFPHTSRAESGTRLASDPLGRVAPWRRIHLVDSAVLPTIPATTFALTVMANAHRIVASTVKELD
jgi:ferredoxin